MDTYKIAKMKKVFQSLINVFFVLGWIIILICSFLAYFVHSYDKIRKVTVDGLGRQVFETPSSLKILLFFSDTWAGFKWMMIDYIVFWGFVALTFFLINRK